MKKIFVIAIAFCSLSLVSCGEKKDESDSTSSSKRHNHKSSLNSGDKYLDEEIHEYWPEIDETDYVEEDYVEEEEFEYDTILENEDLGYPEKKPNNSEEFLNNIIQTERFRESYDQDELEESETAIGAIDFDEIADDINTIRTSREEVVVEENKPVDKNNKVFEAVEQMPQFPGGDAELMKYISAHLVYPTLAAENGIQGRVVVKFVVKSDGTVGDIVIVRSKGPDLDKEAVRVVKTFPKFIPGRMNGQPVNVWFTLPVTFKLQKN